MNIKSNHNQHKFYNLRVASCGLRVAIFMSCYFKNWIYELRVPFYQLQSNLTSCNFNLQVVNKITSCKLLFLNCELLFTNCKFKEIIIRVASCVLWVENLKIFFMNCRFLFTSWKFKMIKFTSCEIAFNKLTNFTNYHHIFESNFQE